MGHSHKYNNMLSFSYFHSQLSSVIKPSVPIAHIVDA